MSPLRRRIGGLVLVLLFAVSTPIASAAERMRGVAVTEERIALVIGNAAYRVDPLDNPVNDARLMAQSLRQSGFAVALHENLDRRALVDALRDFGNRLGENTIAVLYYAGHGLQLRDRNYLIPVDAEIRSEDEIPIAGVDLGFMLGRMSTARSRINIVILDACRNNPFSGKGGPRAQGLAQMDAPVGTLLAYATAPGKLAADGAGANSLYASHLARQLLTPGLPVEHVFKRVREAVVRDTRQLQVPWESSSLQGEFAFVPGVTTARESAADVEAAGELAFWNSIQASTRADEYRAYLRQYPNGRFAALAQTRVAAFTPAPATPPTTAATATTASARADTMPHVGDTWRYRVQDQFRIGDLFLTAKVDGVSAEGVAETWTTTSDAKLRTTLVSLEPGFHTLPGWTLTPPEFSPYLLAAGGLRPGQPIPDQALRVEQVPVALHARIEGEEDIVVAAGRFRAVKLVLRGQAQSRGAARSGSVSIEHVVWYSPQVRRTVKYTVATHVGTALRESTSFELVEFRLN
ncbi:MAG: caspase family protein [Betaproteobacteria bacterium]|nr:MAG: caspase family protein [Betaproteobacteria bacterium]TMH32766.1 MAG: caspase family protein [Betaproteobacteria bacterium]